MNNYKVESGKMPEEFHQKHLKNESVPVIEITCGQCEAQDSVSQADLRLVEESVLENYAAKVFYENGWRYCELPKYNVEGVFCAECIQEFSGREDDSLQQPREKTLDE